MAAHTPTIAREITRRRQASGLGTGCAEAQADGVPCEELDRDCDNCKHAGEAAREAVLQDPSAQPVSAAKQPRP